MKLAAFSLQLRFGAKPAKPGFSLAALPGGLRSLVPDSVLLAKDGMWRVHLPVACPIPTLGKVCARVAKLLKQPIESTGGVLVLSCLSKGWLLPTQAMRPAL